MNLYENSDKNKNKHFLVIGRIVHRNEIKLFFYLCTNEVALNTK